MKIKPAFYKIRGLPFSIAHISDTHNTDCDALISLLLENRRAFDVIMISGDFCNRYHNASGRCEALFKKCADLAPVFISLGNHDIAVLPDADKMHYHGAVLLDNAVTMFRNTAVAGLSSGAENSGQVLRSLRAQQAEYKILLCHHPECAANLITDANLILCGHAHGGQWRIPFIGRGVFAPGQGLFPQYTSGLYPMGASCMAVSPGLSNTVWVPRIFNPKQVLFLSAEDAG